MNIKLISKIERIPNDMRAHWDKRNNAHTSNMRDQLQKYETRCKRYKKTLFVCILGALIFVAMVFVLSDGRYLYGCLVALLMMLIPLYLFSKEENKIFHLLTEAEKMLNRLMVVEPTIQDDSFDKRSISPEALTHKLEAVAGLIIEYEEELKIASATSNESNMSIISNQLEMERKRFDALFKIIVEEFGQLQNESGGYFFKNK